MENHYQISFLPWARIDKAITIGPILLWPFFTEAEQRIKDRKILQYLQRYFQFYVDYKGVPVNSILVCSHEAIDFRYLSEIESKELRESIDILIFLNILPCVNRAVCMNNRSIGPPSADIFELVIQNINFKDNYIAIEAGSITHSGYQIGEIYFPKPFATGGSIEGPDEQLLNAINKCLSADHLIGLKNTLVRTLEWFRLAHIEAGQSSISSKIVMMATAFEIFQTSPKGTRWNFVNYIEKQIASNNMIREIRTNHKGNKKYDLSLAGCWAWDFYELRSKIVHGEKIDANDIVYKDWITQGIVADLIIYQCIKKELFINDCFDKSIREYVEDIEKTFEQKLSEEERSRLLNMRLRYKYVHEALGWIKIEN